MPTPSLTATRSERRWWRGIVRRVERAFESDQLAILQALAAGRAPVLGVWPVTASDLVTGPVQVAVGDRRLALGRVQTAVWIRLAAALAGGPVALAAASRYGRGWVLTFRGLYGDMTLLAARLRFLPADGGAAGNAGAPRELLAS